MYKLSLPSSWHLSPLKTKKYLFALYTLLILFFGICLGLTYEGQSEDGTHYFNVLGHTFYMGFVE